MIDPLRHLSVFQPHAFGNRRVDVVGCGAVGSRIAMSLAKLGIENIHLWDDDRVEEHNIPNQVFDLGDLGKLKVVALAEKIRTATGTAATVSQERVSGAQPLGEVVFLLVDSMESRKEIWEGALKYKLATSLLIETRMGADEGRVYVLNPNRLEDVTGWEKTLYTDAEAETSACGASVSVGPTAEIISGLAVWQLIRWFAVQEGATDELDNQIVFTLRPMMVLNSKFSSSRRAERGA